MIIPRLKQIIQHSQDKQKSFVRTVLKEALQDYVLNFIYNHKTHKNLIFTGGTCLRKIYQLPRLSEDLDFDYSTGFSLKDFTADINGYFKKTLQYKQITSKISNNKQTVFLKFPLLFDIGFAKNNADSPLLFLRCDFAKQANKTFSTEINQISTSEFSFYLKNYDLPTLFANKITAFIQRSFFIGQTQEISFKGRDVFDLVWFIEKSAKQNYSLQPNWPRLFQLLKEKNKTKIIALILEKIKKIKPAELIRDLEPFIDSPASLENFSQNFTHTFTNKLPQLINRIGSKSTK